MRTFIVLVAFLAVACADVSLQAVFQAKWNSFKAAHGKTYSRAEEPKRLQAYLQNTFHIESHNERFAKGEVSFELGHNEFSDMSHDEFKSTMMGFRQPEGLQAISNATVYKYNPSMQMPAGCDWRRYTSTVRNQGSCGSCYSFSAMGALECALSRRNNGYQYHLSEQELVDCSHTHGNYGCDGGFMTASYRYVQQNGIASHDSYPYQERVNSCRAYSMSGKQRIRNHVEIAYGDENGLSQALHLNGAIAIALDANPKSFMMYKSGIYNDPACTTKLTHAVLLVGCGSENGRNFYVVKNSWGTGWGEAGYIRMAAGCNMCGIANMASYPIV